MQQLKKENDTLKQRLENKQEFQKQVELEDKLKESEAMVSALKKEVRSVQRIQLDQGKALQRMTNENDYPQKIKNLMEELRVSRDRVIQLDERLKREEKSSI